MLHSRLDRVGEQIKEALGEIFDREVDNPGVPEFVTIHSVKISKDLHVADVYITFLGDDSTEAIEAAMKAIRKTSSFIRGRLAKKVIMKYHPDLKFHYTRATHYAADLEKLFNKPEFHVPDSETDESEDDN